jgi:hypothetical protein
MGTMPSVGTTLAPGACAGEDAGVLCGFSSIFLASSFLCSQTSSTRVPAPETKPLDHHIVEFKDETWSPFPLATEISFHKWG